jgi:hypothetical protein
MSDIQTKIPLEDKGHYKLPWQGSQEELVSIIFIISPFTNLSNSLKDVVRMRTMI